MNKIIDMLPNVIKKNITTISILITAILSMIYILLFANQYSLAKTVVELEVAYKGYSASSPFSETLDRYMPLLVVEIIVIALIWIFNSLVKNRVAEQSKEYKN
jgi:hypothetical protein